MKILGCDIIQTCANCPESYDVLMNDVLIGDLRLRHGFFAASLESNCVDVFESSDVKGDGLFEEGERLDFITQGVSAIIKQQVPS